MVRRLDWSRTRWEGRYMEPVPEVTDELPWSRGMKKVVRQSPPPEATFAERHQWGKDANWGIGKQPVHLKIAAKKDRLLAEKKKRLKVQRRKQHEKATAAKAARRAAHETATAKTAKPDQSAD